MLFIIVVLGFFFWFVFMFLKGFFKRIFEGGGKKSEFGLWMDWFGIWVKLKIGDRYIIVLFKGVFEDSGVRMEDILVDRDESRVFIYLLDVEGVGVYGEIIYRFLGSGKWFDFFVEGLEGIGLEN